MKLNIIIAEPNDFSNEVLDYLKQFAEVDSKEITLQDIPQCLNDYDVFWFRLGFKLSADILLQSNRCKYIVCPVTGLDHIDLDACKSKGIQVLSLRGETEFLKTVRATAEHTIGLTLALLRHIADATYAVKNGIWNRDLFKGTEIYQKKVGVLGMGRLGTITAGIFNAMGAEVFYYDILKMENSAYKSVSGIEELFEISDILTVHVNYNPTNHHLIQTGLLKKMKPVAILINTSRGGIINSHDLLDALQNKWIAGAALDVIENEFEPNKDVLIQYAKENSNLLITPHIGGNTYESFTKTELFLAQKLRHLVSINQ